MYCIPFHLTTLLGAAGVVADRLLGEPPRWHPLVGFGRLAARVEAGLHPGTAAPPWRGRLAGVGALALLLPLPVGLAGWLACRPGWGSPIALGLLTLALGGRSLMEHGAAVAHALAAGDLPRARQRTGWLVSRETAAMTPAEMARATIESLLENGADALFAPLFWFLLAGAPGVVLYRLANTLDALWGYRTPRHHAFGWAAARLDDLLNWVPARLTAATYLLVGAWRPGWRAWRRDAPRWESPNAGPVMAAGAGALQLRLGGGARYHGAWKARPSLGEGREPEAGDIPRAMALVTRGALLWMGLLGLAGGGALLW